MALNEEDSKVAEKADKIIVEMKPVLLRKIRKATKDNDPYFPAAFATAMIYLAAEAVAAGSDHNNLDENADAATMQLRRTITNLVYERFNRAENESAQEPPTAPGIPGGRPL